MANKFVKAAIDFVNGFDAVAYTKKNAILFGKEDKLGRNFKTASTLKVIEPVEEAFRKAKGEFTVSVSKAGILITEATQNIDEIYLSTLPKEYLDEYEDPEAGKVYADDIRGKAYKVLGSGSLIEAVKIAIEYKLDKAKEYLNNRGKDKVKKYDSADDYLKDNATEWRKNKKGKMVATKFKNKGAEVKALTETIENLNEEITKLTSKGESGHNLNDINKRIVDLMKKNDQSEYGLQGEDKARLQNAIADRKTVTAKIDELKKQVEAKEKELNNILGNGKTSIKDSYETGFSSLMDRLKRVNNFAMTGKFESEEDFCGDADAEEDFCGDCYDYNDCCPSCGTVVEVGWKHCPECGEDLQ